MFKIHKKVKYALIALKYISQRKPDELTTTKEVCERHKIPFDPTARVLQLLAQKGVLQVVQGAHGGYRLLKNLSALSVYELSRIVVGGLAVTDCASDKGACEHGSGCILKGAMAKLNGRVVKAFKGVMVSEMIR